MVKGTPLPVLLTAAFILYRLGIVVYRLCLHPLAKFPGPKIAGVTSLYEAYYEIVLNGQYSKKISELHDIYGESSKYLQVHVAKAKDSRTLDCCTRRIELINCRPHHPSHTTRTTYPRLQLLRRVLWEEHSPRQGRVGQEDRYQGRCTDNCRRGAA